MTARPSIPPLLDARQIVKRFPGVLALDRVDLTLRQGEVLALVGENGAGKSTLMKILAGVLLPDAGQILLEGREVRFSTVRAAAACGIALIHQELNLSTNLDVAANVFLGREPQRWGLLRKRTMAREARRHLLRVGLDCPPAALVERLSIGQRQLVEIARALSLDARVLIMDEPTSSLTQREAEQLFRLVEQLRRTGVSVIYISHRLSEVKRVADRVAVLRDGRNAGQLARDEIEHDAMVRLMVGRDVSQFYQHQPSTPGEVVLEVERLRTAAFPDEELTFQVRAGEIVGVAGLVGAGRSEMLRALFGADRPLGGTVRVLGRPVAPGNPADAIRAGMAFAPEDRRQQGLLVEMSVRENLSLARLPHDQRLGLIPHRRERALAAEMIRRLSIRTPSDGQIVCRLSGGNQQKIVLGKWLALQPRVLLLDEPTRGIDIGAKEEIYRLVERLTAEGVAVLCVSSEMEEVLGLSDRILVMHEGRIAGELNRRPFSEEAVMRLATGRAAAAGEGAAAQGKKPRRPPDRSPA